MMQGPTSKISTSCPASDRSMAVTMPASPPPTMPTLSFWPSGTCEFRCTRPGEMKRVRLNEYSLLVLRVLLTMAWPGPCTYNVVRVAA